MSKNPQSDKLPVLVTGGAGYIGSHAVLELLDRGWPVTVIDDLSTGRRINIPQEAVFVEGDIGDSALVRKTIRQNGCRAVLHFAGSIVVSESVTDPLKYYENNTSKSISLIGDCVAEDLSAFVFSSTAAVYGDPKTVPVDENMDLNPINPYGTSKAQIEQVLKDTSVATGLRYAALRYFNVAGADRLMRSGQSGPSSTHLIRVACEAAVGKRAGMEIFGDDYQTPDGTCVRDYIHVSDLANIHVVALEHLLAADDNMILNCGYGRGFSVRQVIDAVNQCLDQPLNVKIAGRRAGDASELVADCSRLKEVLGWTPDYDDLSVIVKSALMWEREQLAAAESTPSMTRTTS